MPKSVGSMLATLAARWSGHSQKEKRFVDVRGQRSKQTNFSETIAYEKDVANSFSHILLDSTD